jgi:hypothetical protein
MHEISPSWFQRIISSRFLKQIIERIIGLDVWTSFARFDEKISVFQQIR